MTALYEQDFSVWLLKQAEAIRTGVWRDVDLDNLAEEIEAMSRSEKRELITRLAVLMAHLLFPCYEVELSIVNGELAISLIQQYCGGHCSILSGKMFPVFAGRFRYRF